MDPRWRNKDTFQGLAPVGRPDLRSELVLTIACHPDSGRVGEIARVEGARGLDVSRLSPEFLPPRASPGAASEPLADPRLSRKPLRLWDDGDRLRLDPTGTTTTVEIDGRVITTIETLPVDAADRGVLITLGRSVALLLHRIPANQVPGSAPRESGRPAEHGLVGASPAIERVRIELERVAPLDVPVLLRGESGSGKELVARALHDASPRAKRPFVAMNMAAISASTAASELFGHVRGAFTGAARDHDGFFARADGGTLFLDEIGETPPELQPMLLRVLETGDVSAVGATRTRRVDVRVIAATDADLEAMLGRDVPGGSQKQFRAPLFHRLAGYTIAIPPLRERPDDIARLFVDFLRQELTAVGAEARLSPPDDGEPPFVPPALILELLRHRFPGNVRELRNLARQLAISSHDAAVLPVPNLSKMDDAPSASRLGEPVAPARPDAPKRAAKMPVDDDALVAALEAHDWKPGPTAEALGISRTTLYALIERSSRVRKARDVTDAELDSVLAHVAGDLDQAAALLKVSKRGLQLRVKS